MPTNHAHAIGSALIAVLGIIAIMLDRVGVHGDGGFVFWLGLLFLAYGGVARHLSYPS